MTRTRRAYNDKRSSVFFRPYGTWCECSICRMSRAKVPKSSRLQRERDLRRELKEYDYGEAIVMESAFTEDLEGDYWRENVFCVILLTISGLVMIRWALWVWGTI